MVCDVYAICVGIYKLDGYTNTYIHVCGYFRGKKAKFHKQYWAVYCFPGDNDNIVNIVILIFIF